MHNLLEDKRYIDKYNHNKNKKIEKKSTHFEQAYENVREDSNEIS